MKILTLDIGGTAIKSAVYENGALVDFRETETNAHLGSGKLMDTVVRLVEAYRECHALDRLGISTAGAVDPMRGCIAYANDNIPGYSGTPVREILEEATGIPTRVENDVKCAALGEGTYGAGKGIGNFACLTYGTGVGGAIVIDGKLYSGGNFSSAQFGALLIHPEQKRGDADYYGGGYERFASTTALVKLAKRYDPFLSNGRKIFARIEETAVREIVDQWIDEIVLGLCSIVHILNPDVLILGGGIMEQPYLPEQIKAKLMPCLIPTCRNVQVRSGVLGNRAGLYGAAALWLEQDLVDIQ